jgi:hypothetical protein
VRWRLPIPIAVVACAAWLAAWPILAVAGDAARPLAPGDRLPALRGDLLSGRRFVMPDSAAGRNTLLMLGFSYDSRHDVEKWAERFRREFGSDPRVDFYQVPVIGTAGRLGRPFIDGSMRRGLPREMHERVLMVYRDAGQWKRLAGHADPRIGYLLLVGPDGRVAWRGQGPFREDAWRGLAAKLGELAP